MTTDIASYLASAGMPPTEKVEMVGVFIYRAEWPLLADSVEKVGSAKWPEH
jgi:hypothetical protein